MNAILHIIALILTLGFISPTNAIADINAVTDINVTQNQTQTAMSFIEDMSDAPLMTGMTLIDGAGFVFEQQNGRIVEKIAATDQQVQDILNYYGLVMPQLGWTKTADKVGRFSRDKELFTIIIKTVNNVQLVTFRLQPL